jgi:twitching motility protein PilT
VGVDTPSFVDGIHRLLRQDCDVLYVSEFSDPVTAAALLNAAGSGRLVITVTSATSAVGAVAALIDVFPEAERPVIRRTLGTCLRGVCIQHLLERSDGRGRVPAVEVLVGTARVAEVLLEPHRELEQLDKVILDGQYHGMVSMQQSLYDLCVEGAVPVADAMRLAPAPEELRISLHRAGLAAG